MNVEEIKQRCPELIDSHWRPANGKRSHTCRVRSLPPPDGSYLKLPYHDIMFSLGDVPIHHLAQTLFYGNPYVNGDREFLGLEQMYCSLDRQVAQSSANVISAGGDGCHNTSIYLVTWGPQTAYFAHHEEGDYNRYGLVIEDWRYVVRIANIDLDCGEPDVIGLMARAMLRLPTLGRNFSEAIQHSLTSRAVFYMALRTAKLLGKQLESYPRNADVPPNYFRGLPFYVASALRHDEPTVR